MAQNRAQVWRGYNTTVGMTGGSRPSAAAGGGRWSGPRWVGTGRAQARLRSLGVSVRLEDHVWFEDRWMVASLCDE
jgi:hypothetical protein